MGGPYTVVFPAGVTSSQFNVSIINDAEREQSETFQLTINSTLLNVSAVSPDQATVIITDDDCK